MISASRLAAKIDYYQLIKNGCIYISSAQIFGFDGNFYKKTNTSKPNYQFVLDSLSSKDKNKKSNLKLSINSLIIRHGAIRYDIYDAPYTSSHFNLKHIKLNDISAHIIIPYYTQDSTYISVKKLSFKESSGLDLRRLSFDFSFNKKCAKLHNFNLSLPNSKIESESLSLVYKTINGKIDNKTIAYSGAININRINFSDLKCFLPRIKHNITPLSLKATFTGAYNNINIESFNLHSIDKD